MEKSLIQPRLIIHGGAGNVGPENLSPQSWAKVRAHLVRIYRSTNELLQIGETALDAATHAVTLFEDCESFNCGKGAFAKVMTTQGNHKRASAVVLLKHVKNPIKLAREMLVRKQQNNDAVDGSDDAGDPKHAIRGDQGHVCLGSQTAEKLARQWGLEMVNEDYFWTKKRWEEHKRGLGERLESHLTAVNDYERGSSGTEPAYDNDSEGWDGKEYLPQGTVGCVALDKYGTMCTATSTGGFTNKLPYRIGDTPTVGAGFWAEEWSEAPLFRILTPPLCNAPPRLPRLVDDAVDAIKSCFGMGDGYQPLLQDRGSTDKELASDHKQPRSDLHSVAISGTGNGDSFLRLSAARTAGAIVRFSYPSNPVRTLASAINQVAGPGGDLQKSAEDRWRNGFEGMAGMIGIELRNGKGKVCSDYNCGGMFRCYGDEKGTLRVAVYREEEEIG